MAELLDHDLAAPPRATTSWRLREQAT